MTEFFIDLFSTQKYMPHGICYQWDPAVLWLHVIADVVIGLAYMSIPITLLYFRVKRMGSEFSWVLSLFVLFILLCGFTHFVSVITAWQPIYRFEGILKALTALASIGTAIVIVPLVPKVLARPTNEQLQAEINNRRAAEQQLERTVKELERSNRELNQFATIASHDLQAPLRNILGYTGLLKKRYNDSLDEKGQEFLHFASSSAATMQRLVQDLLTLSRVGHGRLVAEPVPMESLAKETETRLASLISNAGATVTWPTEMPVLSGNRGELVQLFQNLLGNAIKFAREGVPPEVHISIEQREKNWQIAISDNGIGIQEEYQEQIFEVFNRLHSQQDFEGSGVGLAVCEKVVKRHQGSLRVESELGKGSTFYITLPIRPVDTSETEPREP